jgi:hypothetical protein
MCSTSDTQYFIQRGGSVKGPYSLSKLQSGLASGKLRDSDGVAANKSGPWQPLGRWIRNATASEDDNSDDLIGQPYEDETDLDALVRLMRDANPLVRAEDSTSERSGRSLRQRIEDSGVEVDWDVLLGNLKKLALLVGGIAAAGMILWFGLPMASRAFQQFKEYREELAQEESAEPAQGLLPAFSVFGAKSAINACVNGFLREQENGYDGEQFWSDPKLAEGLIAVRGWKILDYDYNADSRDQHGRQCAWVPVRIDSSNKGGMQITLVWKFFIVFTEDGWKIALLLKP